MMVIRTEKTIKEFEQICHLMWQNIAIWNLVSIQSMVVKSKFWRKQKSPQIGFILSDLFKMLPSSMLHVYLFCPVSL